MNRLRARLRTALAYVTRRFMPSAPAEAPLTVPAGRDLRTRFLSTRAADLGLTPGPDTPTVFGAAFDWPVGPQFATIAALTDGSASLYTTASYNILGGEAHAPVRAAAQRFIASAAPHLDRVVPLRSHPYPAAQHARLYLLTIDGLRSIELQVDDLLPGQGHYAQVFADAQNVLEALRKTA